MVAPYRQKSPSDPSTDNAAIDPSRAVAGVARWRRALAESLGQDPGTILDEPRRQLTMLKVFGSTKRLADLCLKHPAFASKALIEGPSGILAEAARDLTALNTGVGGAEALHSAMAPIKARADIAISLAEISNVWTTAQACTARADLAERLVEVALLWLIRAAINRGELTVLSENYSSDGVFALAGGDFAHEDLAPLGPVDLLVVYDQTKFAADQMPMTERAFARIGAELRDAFEGGPGDLCIYGIRTPMGSGVNGAGFVESRARMEATLEDPQANDVRRWIATARVVAGDRTNGGAFLEESESALWTDDPVIGDISRDMVIAESKDPRDGFRSIANLLRWSLGKRRPIFRTASTSDVFATASSSSILPVAVAERLSAGYEFTSMLVSRSQAMKGTHSFEVVSADEEAAIASLCDFSDFAHLSCVREGVLAEARNAGARILEGTRSDFDRYAVSEQAIDDIDKLEDLGFRNGEKLSGLVDGWANLCKAGGEKRFAAIAPGLLTAFGETQRPDIAVKLFDQILTTIGGTENEDATSYIPSASNALLVDAVGCLGAAVAPLSLSKETVGEFFAEHGSETPTSVTEWMSRYPAVRAGASSEDVKAWREQSIARVALFASGGCISFGVAADVLAAIHSKTLTLVFETMCAEAEVSIALHVFKDSRFGLPGAPTSIGFTTDAQGDDTEDVARAFLQALVDIGDGIFAISPDVSHRPSGVAGALVPNAGQVKGYIQSEAVAHDQILLARAEVIAGPDALCATAQAALRTAIANPQRADVLFRDLDRARAQRLRRDKAGSEWDLGSLEGGPLDVDLIISTLIFRHAAAHPSVQKLSADDALDFMVRSELISQPVADTLKSARRFWARIGCIRSLSQWTDPEAAPVRKRFGQMIARAAEVKEFTQVRPIKNGYAEEATRLYAQLVLGRPSVGLKASA